LRDQAGLLNRQKINDASDVDVGWAKSLEWPSTMTAVQAILSTLFALAKIGMADSVGKGGLDPAR
jgi:hypothetical protein